MRRHAPQTGAPFTVWYVVVIAREHAEHDTLCCATGAAGLSVAPLSGAV
ncbi:MAG: hypothetical protein IT357_06430 [Gemmatimonadaceae bacterium]|nr:hypothetical protein [Gemmatimonadaceae bacterium]